MTTTATARINRTQIQERFKNNFNAWHASCSHLTKPDPLDDSLTNLQWLQNLNVNMVNPLCSIDSPGTTSNKLSSKRTCYGNKRTISRPNSHGFPRTINNTNKINLNNFCGFSTNKIPLNKANVPKKLTLSLSTLESSDINEFLKLENVVHGAKDQQLEVDGNTPCTSAQSPLLSQASPQCASRNSATRNFFRMDEEDYKNNQDKKPPFSNAYLIWTAMRSMRRNKITLTSIYRWVKDNFLFYRNAEFNWQAPLRHCLLTNKCFERVPKNKDDSTKSTYWRINPIYEDAIMKGFFNSKNESSSALFKVDEDNMLKNISSPFEFIKDETRLDSIGNEIFPLSSMSGGRKRKQTFPLKVIKKKTKKSQQTASINNLQDQAPELGSLKGDYNWNSLLINDFGEDVNSDTVSDNNNILSHNSRNKNPKAKPNKFLSPQSMSDSVNIGDFLSDVMLTSDMADDQHKGSYKNVENDENICLSPHKINESYETVEEEIITSVSPSEWIQGSDSSLEDLTLSSIFGPGVKRSLFSDSSNVFAGTDGNTNDSFPEYALETDESLDGFLKDVDSLDLTVTGKQIEPPAEWVPVGVSLDSILCEKQDDNLGLNELNNNISLSQNFLDNSFVSNSPVIRPSKRKPRNSTNNRNTQRRSNDKVAPFLHPNQEIKSATDTIESLLAKDSGLDGF